MQRKNAVSKFIEAILDKYDWSKFDKKHFNKNFIIYVKGERRFKSYNKCWVGNKLFVAGGNDIGDHDHVTGKHRNSVHWNCNIILKLTKKVSAILNNFKDHESHLIMQEIDRFDVKISVKPNGLEKMHSFYN